MNGFSLANAVEARAWVIIHPFIQAKAHNGMMVWPNDSPAGIAIQKSHGDIIMQTSEREVSTIELKAEEEFTGNLFLETWSNKNLCSQKSHAERGSEPGWLVKSRADLLLYYFLDTDDLFVCKMLALQRWAFGDGKPGKVWGFQEVRQNKYVQKNDTWGHLVSIDLLKRDLTPAPHIFHPAKAQFHLNGAESDVSRGQQYV
jgi:hypothetical protein